MYNTNIKVGDKVCLIELWPDETGKLVPDQTTLDCRLFGVCVEVHKDLVFVCPEVNVDGLWFRKEIGEFARQGDSIVVLQSEANILYPVKPVV